METILTSGGKLVVFDSSGTYGFFPLVEIGKDFQGRTAVLKSLYLERPRYLNMPYPREVSTALAKIKQQHFPKADLLPAFVLPVKTEHFVLGALEKVLKDKFYDYDSLHGEYTKDSQGRLIFTITKGKKQGYPSFRPLQKPIEIRFGLIT